MRANKLLPLLLILLFVPSVLAFNELDYYNAQSDYVDNGFMNNVLGIHSSGATICVNQTKVGNSSYCLSGDAQGFYNLSRLGTINSGNYNMSLSYWLYLNESVSSGDYAFITVNNGTAANKVAAFGFENDYPMFFGNGNNAIIQGLPLVNGSGSKNLNKWAHYLWTYNTVGKNMSLFFNGTFAGSVSLSNPPVWENAVFVIGNSGIVTGGIKGYVSDVRFWNGSSNALIASLVYNGGAGTNNSYPNLPFSISAFDTSNNVTINNFSAVINGTLYTTTNGLINTTLISGVVNISVNFTGYQNKNYKDYTVSNMLIVSTVPVPSISVFAFTESSTPVALSNFSAYFQSDVSNFGLNTTTGSIFTQVIPVGQYNVIVGSDGYNNRTYFLNVNGNDWFNVSAYLLSASSSSSIILTVQDGSGHTIQGALFTLSFTDLAGVTHVVEQGLTDVSGEILLSSDPSKSYTYSLFKDGYTYQTGSIILNVDKILFLQQALVSVYDLYAGASYNVSITPEGALYSPMTMFNISASVWSSNNSLQSVLLSVPLNDSGACVNGAWDGQNCTSLLTGSGTTLGGTLIINTSVIGNNPVSFLVFTKVQGFNPSLSYRTYFYSSPLFTSDNRTVYNTLAEGFDKFNLTRTDKIAIIFALGILVGLFLWSIGLSVILTFIIMLLAMLATFVMTMGTDLYVMGAVAGIVSVVIIVVLLKSGGRT